MQSPNYQKILDMAFRMLSRQDYSRHKMVQKLKDKSFESEEIAPVIARLEELGYLDEEKYAQAKIKGLLRKSRSRSFIERKLAEEKIQFSDELFQSCLNELDTNPDQIVDDLINKKLRTLGAYPSDFKEKQKYFNKVVRFLASKGHRVDFDGLRSKIEHFSLEN